MAKAPVPVTQLRLRQLPRALSVPKGYVLAADRPVGQGSAVGIEMTDLFRSMCREADIAPADFQNLLSFVAKALDPVLNPAAAAELTPLVNGAVQAGAFVPKTGGTMTGPLAVPDGATGKQAVNRDTINALLTAQGALLSVFGRTGSVVAAAADYDDTLIAAPSTASAYTPTASTVRGHLAGLNTAMAGRMVKANNLSDLNNIGIARTNLGLGAAALLAVGTGAGTVAAGDDSRFGVVAVERSVSAATTLVATDRAGVVVFTGSVATTWTINAISAVGSTTLINDGSAAIALVAGAGLALQGVTSVPVGGLVALSWFGGGTKARAVLVGTAIVAAPEKEVPFVGGSATVDYFSVPPTAYTRPPNAIYVSVANGNDTTGTGSVAAPYATIQKGVDVAVNGRTIVVRAGEYKENVSVFSKQITIQPYEGEIVWLEGREVVTGIVADGAQWKRTTYPHMHREGGIAKGAVTIGSEFLDPSFPMAPYPDQLWVDEVPQELVVSKALAIAGKFWVDYATNTMWMGTNPTGKTVKAAARAGRALDLNIANGTIARGIGVRGYATYWADYGMVALGGNNNTLENCTVLWSGADGVSLFASGAVLKGCRIGHNGNSGGGGAPNYSAVTVTDNFFGYNNRKRWNKSWAAAGFKITKQVGGGYERNIFEGNFAPGLWCDINCDAVAIVRNVSRNNLWHGFYYEISKDANIAGNLAHHNDGSGYFVVNSNGCKIWNNTSHSNASAYEILETGVTPDAEAVSRGQTYLTEGTVFWNNLYSETEPSTNAPFVMTHYGTTKRGGAFYLASWNHNGHHYPTAAPPNIFINWGEGSGGGFAEQYLGSHSAWRSFNTVRGRDYDANAVVQNGAVSPFVAADDYRLKPGNAFRSAGAGLPADIAMLLGITAGVPVDIGALPGIN